MPEPCPFCGKPIVREYGSFRCKHCAGSSEDLIDQERKARAAEVRKLARDSGKGGATVAPAPSRTSAAVVVPEPPSIPKAKIIKAKTAKAKPITKPAKPAARPATAGKTAEASAEATVALPKTKSARLRMVSAAAARIAERKKTSPGDDAPPVAPKKARK